MNHCAAQRQDRCLSWLAIVEASGIIAAMQADMTEPRPFEGATTFAADAAVAPLHGLRVIELGQVLAAPFAGAIFADLGAQVLKIERLEGGDDARRMGEAFRLAQEKMASENEKN